MADYPIHPAAETTALPALVDRAVSALANARTAAEVLEARDMASFAYDAAKKMARLAQAKSAHDSLVAAAHRTQANALTIEAEAKRRLADEYDAAQERGEVATRQTARKSSSQQEHDRPATTADIGLSRKQIHEARMIRDVEKTEPGVVRRAVNEALAAGEEPTKARVRRAVIKASKNGKAGAGTSIPRRPPFRFWVQLREGLEKINGLPAAKEVAQQVHRTARDDLGRKVDTAIAWLENFKQEWEGNGAGNETK